MTRLLPCWVAILITIAASAAAQVVIPDRATLNSLISGNGATENFENFVQPSGTAKALSITTLDVSTLVDGQGPGLVLPGLTFSGSGIQWNEAAYFSAPSREILANGNVLTVDFSTPATAVGLDLRDFSGYSLTATVTIYAADDTTVVATIPSISVGSVPVFFGYQAPAIGKIELSTANSSWSPIIDNLGFTPIPEPPIALLLGLGSAVVACRRMALGR